MSFLAACKREEMSVGSTVYGLTTRLRSHGVGMKLSNNKKKVDVFVCCPLMNHDSKKLCTKL